MPSLHVNNKLLLTRIIIIVINYYKRMTKRRTQLIKWGYLGTAGHGSGDLGQKRNMEQTSFANQMLISSRKWSKKYSLY